MIVTAVAFLTVLSAMIVYGICLAELVSERQEQNTPESAPQRIESDQVRGHRWR